MRGFTLAEVLITLGIIGVVAALTMPSLIARHQEKVTVTKVAKNYSIISNAYNMIKSEEGPMSEWGTSDDNHKLSDAMIMGEKFEQYLRFTKLCKDKSGCWPDAVYKRLNSQYWTNVETQGFNYKGVLEDGTLFSVYQYTDGGVPLDKHGVIDIDINGFKGPNTLGKDVFRFSIVDRTVSAMGSVDVDPDISDCIGKDAIGNNCAAWVIFAKNLDYLKCPGQLSWEKTTCP
jgi:prepilin-type N-terminal cleavage/methylation domain-containing protein